MKNSSSSSSKSTSAARHESHETRDTYEYVRLKDYLRHKMCHLRHRLIIFFFYRKIIFCFQDIQVFVFLTIPWFTESVTSQWVTIKSPNLIDISQLIDISKGSNFQESLKQFRELGLSSRTFSIKQPAPSTPEPIM